MEDDQFFSELQREFELLVRTSYAICYKKEDDEEEEKKEEEDEKVKEDKDKEAEEDEEMKGGEDKESKKEDEETKEEEECGDPAIDGIGAGLQNLGNTCFLNSVLQCLTHTPSFAHLLNTTPHPTPCMNKGFCAFCALNQHVRIALSSSGKAISPSQFVDNLSNTSSLLQEFQQEDAHEYMLALLNSLHRNSTLSPQEANDNQIIEQDSFVQRLFGGCLRRVIKCQECSHCSENFEPVIDLSLPIDDGDSLKESLEYFTRVQNVERNCENCNCKSAGMEHRINKAPEVLIIHLKRFSNTSKVDKRVSYPYILDLKPFAKIEEGASEGDLKYVLYGVLVHSGSTMDFGHYYSFVRTQRDATWYMFDDATVSEVDVQTVFQQKAYILFYYKLGGESFCGENSELQIENVCGEADIGSDSETEEFEYFLDFSDFF